MLHFATVLICAGAGDPKRNRLLTEYPPSGNISSTQRLYFRLMRNGFVGGLLGRVKLRLDITFCY